jgi:oxygen-dependent protoporphyrinogen oxidase
MRIGIIGAGLSGLATACYLSRLLTGSRIVVFDAEPRPGGTLQTVEIEGFRFETGANGFLTGKPDCLQLVREAGLEDRVVSSATSARRRFIYTDRLHLLPESPPLFLRSELLSWREKLRVAGELFVRPRRDAGEESLRQFGDRRLGPAFTQVFLDAMAAGIYGSTPDRLSVQAAFPMIAELERAHGGLLRGMIARRRAAAARDVIGRGAVGPGGGLVSLTGGIGTLAQRLAELIPCDWRLDDPVRAVTRPGMEFRIAATHSTAEVDQVIVCAPAFAAAEMLAPLDAALAAQLARVEYTPIAVVGFGYRTCPVPLNGFGLLTTSASQVPILGVTWDSSIFPERAPAGGCSLRVMIGGQRAPELVSVDERRLIDIARAGLRTTMQIERAPDVSHVRRWPRGIPSYSPGHPRIVDAVFERLLRIPGLYLNCNAYRGVAMNDCARASRELALRIATRQ